MNFEEFEKELVDVFERDFRIHDQGLVDGCTWFTVSCSHKASLWLRRQSRELWHEHIQNKWDVIHNTFDVHETLYTLLVLKWS